MAAGFAAFAAAAGAAATGPDADAKARVAVAPAARRAARTAARSMVGGAEWWRHVGAAQLHTTPGRPQALPPRPWSGHAPAAMRAAGAPPIGARPPPRRWAPRRPPAAAAGPPAADDGSQAPPRLDWVPNRGSPTSTTAAAGAAPASAPSRPGLDAFLDPSTPARGRTESDRSITSLLRARRLAPALAAWRAARESGDPLSYATHHALIVACIKVGGGGVGIGAGGRANRRPTPRPPTTPPPFLLPSTAPWTAPSPSTGPCPPPASPPTW